ncbi:MAG: glycosyltransferase family 1 protein, partial [Pirellulales bacterium]
MTDHSFQVAYLTPGAGGMICGSCLNDNMLASELQRLGCDCVLVPLYTPIRTDEPDVSIRKVFFGGVNVYLQQKSGLFRSLPRWADRALDSPRFLRAVTGRAISVEAKHLGGLTVSMIRGEEGRQRKEITRLVDWLARDLRPDLVHLSNLMIAGCVPRIKQRLGAAVLVTLQG